MYKINLLLRKGDLFVYTVDNFWPDKSNSAANFVSPSSIYPANVYLRN